MKFHISLILLFCLCLAAIVAADVVLVLSADTAITVTGASINEAGTQLTITYSTSTTVSDATGLTCEFDNYAQRTLTYVSGSGTDTHVFSFAAPAAYTDADTDNDTAPVGTVCTIDYDSGTGNISGLGTLTDQAVTNNSTVIPDADLPEVLEVALPDNWDDPADFTPADADELQTAFNTAQPGDVIQLTVGVDYVRSFTIPATTKGTAENPIIVRSGDATNLANLPSYGLTNANRVDPSHLAYMGAIVGPDEGGANGRALTVKAYKAATLSVGNPATFTSVGHGLTTGDQVYLSNYTSTPSVNGSHTVTVTGPDTFTIPVNVTSVTTQGLGFSFSGAAHFYFLGVEFTSANDNQVSFSNLIYMENTLAEHQCDGWTWDRCIFHGITNQTYCNNCLTVNGKRVAILSNYFFDVHSTSENGGVGTINYTGAGPQRIENNYFQCGTPVFIGAQAPNNPIPRDVTVRGNVFDHDNSYHPSNEFHPSYDVKNHFESKNVIRNLIEENVFRNGDSSAQTYYDIFKIACDGDGSRTMHTTIRWNLGSGSQSIFSPDSGGSDTLIGDLTCYHNLCYDCEHLGTWSAGFSGTRRFIIRNNTFIGSLGGGNWPPHPIVPDPGAGLQFIYLRDNILHEGGSLWKGQGVTAGYLSLNSATPDDAWYDIQYQFITNSASTNYNSGAQAGSFLQNNVFPGSLAGMGFVGPGTSDADWEIDDTSDYASASSTGGKPGCDVPTLLNSHVNGVE